MSAMIKRVRATIPPPLVALVLAVILFLVGGVLAPGFNNPDQAVNIARLAAFLGIIAAGQTLVIISGGEGIDLSAGALVTLGAILTYRVTNGDDAMILPALALVLVVGALFMIATTIADLLQASLNPRIRFGSTTS